FRMRWAMTAGVLALAGSLAPKAAVAPPQLLTLPSEGFPNTRHIRVLLPPAHTDPLNASRRSPLCSFFYGICALAPSGVPAAAAALWDARSIPPAIFVGIDNGGSTAESTNPGRDRAQEYLPYADPSWTGKDAPVPLGDRLPAFLFDEVMPLVNARYRTSTA